VARTELTPARQIALGVAWLLFIVGVCVALNARVGKTDGEAPLAGGALPPELAGATTSVSGFGGTQASSSLSGSSSSSQASVTRTVTVKPAPRLIPVAIDIPISSGNYPDGLKATVTSHPLNGDGTLFVPDDPKTVSWANQDAAPGDTVGTVILTSHVNFVIDGSLVVGAFADLAEYARSSVGRKFTLTMADGSTMTYQITAGREYSKDQLAGNDALRKELYDQSKSYGAPGKPRTSRLLLVSCGGAFDNASGEYEDNVFLYALPVKSAPPAPQDGSS
jgi:hypothetical protein